MTFIESLKQRWNQSHSLLCVGLDPDINRIPESIRSSKTCFYDFCTAIVDATAQYACSFKPQIAYFASRAAESELEGIIEYIHKNYPDIPVILDAKRGDIGSTAKHYAKEAFENLGMWDDVEAKTSFGTNVTEVLSWVAAGSADAGIVYLTDATTSDQFDQVEIVGYAPEGSVSKVIYPVGIVAASQKKDAAQKFVDFLGTEEAMAAFADYGFSANE